jgi:DNA-binding NarL/FixJ family response regulator
MEVIRNKDGRGLDLDHRRADLAMDEVVVSSSVASNVVLINENHLVRDCMERVLSEAGASVVSYLSVAECIDSSQRGAGPALDNELILLCIGPGKVTDEVVVENIEALLEHDFGRSLVIMGELDTLQQVAGAIRMGAKGYLSMQTPLQIALGALNLVRAGGVYVPVSTFLPGMERDEADDEASAAGPASGVFTTRQLAVVSALRQGKPNKLIAYELNMSESTVKVHVRNIMRRLGARNRTEVAFRTNQLFAGDAPERIRSGKPAVPG